jgi:hypothetical protein
MIDVPHPPLGAVSLGKVPPPANPEPLPKHIDEDTLASMASIQSARFETQQNLSKQLQLVQEQLRQAQEQLRKFTGAAA